ncbi:NfeD family protein [Roseivirga sp. E12]|uniref:NfeD family protein n=1 Tax=Roseivirga sp. E12 TaxID=2819237 RepID=UPI001ABCF737|nr:NfeD family protein [Roseivirga sp. E12]MBO3700787.1 NfeD family protein [Roseivirga sp. E12]
MDGWLAIILLTLVGLVLIYLELIFVPGTTILGLLGLALTGIGIYMAYERHGVTSGSIVLVASLLVTVIALVWSFRSNSWSKFSLKEQIRSKVNEHYTVDLRINMKGLAVSDLKPIGKAEFNNKAYEVTSHGHLIESGTEVEIIRLSGNKIIVESINT